VSELASERLVLRPWRLEDAEAALRIYNDPDVMRFLGGAGPFRERTLDEQREVLRERIAADAGADGPRGFWAAVERESATLVGSAILKPLPGHAMVEIGWHLGRFAWGRGFATEIGRTLIAHGFGDLGLSRLVAVVHPENIRSIRVAERLGMAYGGRVRAYDLDLELFTLDSLLAQDPK
jgi:[ribosomal protein S5]-alanine N-acetyltransferase